jgi:large repetitive protein
MPVRVDTFEPEKGPVGLLVKIYGSGFDAPKTKVYFFDDAQATHVVVTSAEEIETNVPSGARSGIIRVENDEGTGRSSKEFEVVTEGVWIFRFTPRSGGAGKKVEIVGKGFISCESVMFGKKNAQSFRVVSDTEIEASVPYDAQRSKVKIKISTPKGVGESTTDFEIT